MTCGIIRPLGGVDQVGVILGNEILEEAMQVRAGSWIGILVDHKTGTGVLEKDGGETGRDATALEKRGDLAGDLVGPLPRGGKGEALGDGHHDAERNEATPISNQPAMSRSPPMGVIAPIQEILVRASAERLPEKRRMPEITQRKGAVATTVPLANQRSTGAWTR